MNRKTAWLEIRSSPIQGRGAFAVLPIRKGTRVTEYRGERISTEEADARYAESDQAEHPRVLLFIVDKKTVIDAGVNGNEAQYINHSCESNCKVVVSRKRVFIVAGRDIPAGAELTYDYNLEREGDEDKETERRFACHCGAKACRGTMLAPKSRRAKKRRPHN